MGYEPATEINWIELKYGLEVTQDHSNWPVSFESLGAVSSSPCIVTMAVCLTVSETFNVKV